MAKPAAAAKDPLTAVQYNAILCETILKEHRYQKIFKNYSINPYKKIHTISGKPNSFHDTEEGDEDSTFKEVLTRAQQEPVKKYLHPQTEAQEIGWMTQPLIDTDKTDKRLHFARQNSAITRYMEAAWKIKEQTENLS